MIDRETLHVVVLGPKNDKGFFREKKLQLHCISFFEETKQKAFEVLRDLLVGQKVQFDDYKLQNGQTGADVFLGKKLVSFTMVSEGLASVNRDESKLTKYITDLKEGQILARENNKGFYGELPKKRKRKLKKLETFQDKVISGFIEEFNY